MLSGSECVDADLMESMKKIVTAMIAQYSSPVIDANAGEDASEAWDDCDVCVCMCVCMNYITTDILLLIFSFDFHTCC